MTGSAQAVMQAVLDDLQTAVEGADGWAYQRNLAMEGLVELYGRQPDDPDELRTFRARSAELLERLGRGTSNFVLDTLARAQRPGDDDWGRIALWRSAIQSLLDDYPGTGVPALVDPDDLEELDEELREIAPEMTPIPEERIPRGLPDTHWWWRLPDRS